MKDYSIEHLTEKINSNKTKIYFKEVSSSYFNGNYRAAIVTLYSVVINDILIKLEILEELYSDKTAKSILDEIKTFQKENPTNPDWEKSIIDEVKNRTNLLDNVDYVHILSLKNDRHLCAHPVIDKDEKLYTPSKEVVAAHIRNMLESLFLKPAILSKKIITTLIKDLAEKKELLIDDESLEKYLSAKYFNNLNSTVELAIFRDLWKFVFNLTNTDAETNRLINYRTLHYIFYRNRLECIDNLKQDITFYSNIADNKNIILFLIKFISENEFLFDLLREDIKLLIFNRVKTDLSAKIVAWFLSENLLLHLNNLKTISREVPGDNYSIEASELAYRRLFKICIAKGLENDLVKYIIFRYSKSRSYYDADFVFNIILKPNLDLFKEEHFKNLFEESNKNNQVYNRRDANEHHKIIKAYIKNHINNKFNFTEFVNLF